jgi:hypothetical protein
MWDVLGERGTGLGFFLVLQFCPFSITQKKSRMLELLLSVITALFLKGEKLDL